MSVDVRNMKKPILYEDILKVLYQSLGTEHQDTISTLAAHVCAEKADVTLDDAFKALFHHGFTIPQLLSALLQCESLRMQRLFSGHAALPLDKQFDSLQHVIHHFNAIQDVILNVGKNYLLQAQNQFTQQENSSQDDSGRLVGLGADDDVRKKALATSLKAWVSEKKISLHNFFQGIPIHATVSVLKADLHSVHVKANTDLIKVFSCQATGDVAYVVCTSGQNQFRITIGKVSSDSVELKLGEMTESILSRRKNLGVRTPDEVMVDLSLRGRVIKKVFLCDISSAGLGFSIPNMDKEPCLTGEVIECRFQLGERRIDASGWVRWVGVMNGEVRMGMELRTHVGIQQALQKEVFRIQRQIIVALNDLDIPEKLTKILT